MSAGKETLWPPSGAVLIVFGGIITAIFIVTTFAAPAKACSEALIWLRPSRGGSAQEEACPEPGQRIEAHEHASGAIYAVCRCPESAR